MTYLIGSSKVLAKGAAVAVATVMAIGPMAGQERVNPQGALIKGFLDRAAAYVALQQKADDGLPKLTPSNEPSKMEAQQAALKARIRLARPNAKPGDIFGEAASLFRDVLRKDAAVRTARDSKAALEEVPLKDPVRVNADYPAKAPLATVPPLILGELPQLPEGLEYRFMGRDLILRDVRANLVADFINDGAASIKKDAAPPGTTIR